MTASYRRRPPTSPRGSATPATSATTRWRRSPSSRCGCSGRCCSRASPAPARPRWPRRSPRRSTCRWSGCSATRASTRPRRSTTGTSRGRSCTCARSRRPAPARDVEEAEKSLYDERFLLARPVLRRAAAEPGGAAGRRGGPGRRRVRGVPARGAVDVPGDASPSSAPSRAATPPVVVLTSNRTRELHDALKRRCLYHWIDHPGLEREVADRPLAGARGLRGAGPPGGRRRAAAARDARPAQAAGRGRDPRLGARPAPPRHHRARPRVVGRATLGALVKYREDADRVPAGARPDAARHDVTAATSASPTRSCSASPGRCAPPGCRSPRTARTATSRRSRWSGSTTARRRTAPAGRRCAPRPTTWRATTRCYEAYFNAPRRAAPAAAGRRTERPTLAGLPLAEDDGDGAGDVRRPRCVRAMASDDRGAAAPRRRLAVGRREGSGWPRCSRPCARARRAGVPPGTSPGTAATSTRRAPCAPACAGWASPAAIAWRRRGTPAAPGGAAGRRVRLDERVRRRAAAARAPVRPTRRRPAASRRSPSAPG